MECPICIEKRTEKNCINCPVCENMACNKCYKTYIMNSGKDAVNCMHCNIIFNRSSILKMFGKSFLTKTLLDYQKEIRFKIFQTRFPEVLPHIENIKELERLKSEKTDIDNEINILTTTYTKTKNDLHDVVYDPEKKEGIDYKMSKNQQLLSVGNINIEKITNKYYRNKNKLHDKSSLISRRINHLIHAINFFKIYRRLYDGTLDGTLDRTYEETHESKKTYSRPCFTIDCKGFLDTNLYCGICNKKYCSDCYELKTTEEHTCNPEIKDNIKLLKKDTKRCPKCNTGIYKIDGCDQMYCTNCHTAFSWNTGNIVKGVIHNPHYFEYLRRTRETMPTMEEMENEFQNIGCHEDINIHRITLTLLSRIANNTANADEYYSYNYVEVYTNMLRIPIHLNFLIEQNQEKILKLQKNDIDNMIEYILDKINRVQFDRNTSKDKKKIEFIQELIDIITTCRDITSDSIRKTYNNAIALLDEFDSIHKYDSKIIKDCFYNCINEIKNALEYSEEAYKDLVVVYQFKPKISFIELYHTSFMNINNVVM